MAPAQYVYRIHDAATNLYTWEVFRYFAPASDRAKSLNYCDKVLGGSGHRFAAVNTTIQYERTMAHA